MRGAEECVNGATTASSPSSHQPLIQSSEWEELVGELGVGGATRQPRICVKMLNGKFQHLLFFNFFMADGILYVVCNLFWTRSTLDS